MAFSLFFPRKMLLGLLPPSEKGVRKNGGMQKEVGRAAAADRLRNAQQGERDVNLGSSKGRRKKGRKRKFVWARIEAKFLSKQSR